MRPCAQHRPCRSQSAPTKRQYQCEGLSHAKLPFQGRVGTGICGWRSEPICLHLETVKVQDDWVRSLDALTFAWYCDCQAQLCILAWINVGLKGSIQNLCRNARARGAILTVLCHDGAGCCCHCCYCCNAAKQTHAALCDANSSSHVEWLA